MSDSSLQSRGNAVYQYTGVDLSASRGLLLKSDGAGGFAVNDSATVPAVAVVLDGAVAAKVSSVGILGGLPGPVFVKLGGTVKAFSRIQQKNDGTVVADLGAGNARVVVGCLGEVGGDAGDYIPAVLFEPVILP
jgi:hypothetical protein